MTTHRTRAVAYHRIVVSGLMAAATLAFSGCAGGLSHAGEAGAARMLMSSEPQTARGNEAGRPVSSGGWDEANLEAAPGVFEARGRAAWDGDRTLQGVWIAHPEADRPRRVRIFNADNGRLVDGALFRRRSDEPGPDIVISSDAASALGMSAKRPAELRIVALRPLPPEIQPMVEQDPREPATETAGTRSRPMPSAGRFEVIPPEPALAAGPAAAEDATAPPDPGEFGETAQTPASGVAGGGPARRAASGTGPPEARTAQRTGAGTGVAPARASMIRPVNPVPATAAAAPPEDPAPAETDRVASEPKADRPIRGERPPPTGATDIAEPEEAEPEDEAPRLAAGLQRPFVQAGIFAVPGNARRLIDRLRGAGLPAQGHVMRLRGRDVTRVVVGPFRTRRDLRSALTTVRRIGPDDALPVKE